MEVLVILTITREDISRLSGRARIFDNRPSCEVRDKILDGLGFWLENWRYDGHSGPTNKSKLFIPWANCAMVQILE